MNKEILKDICVLYVEDENDVRKFTAKLLDSLLKKVYVAQDGLEGLKIFEENKDDRSNKLRKIILKIEIFLNRSQKSTDNSHQKQYTFGSFQFEPENYLLKNDNQSITLTEREASLLKLFLDNPNTVLKREKILMELWGSDDYFLGRSLDVFISRLRKIIKEETHVRIENIPRVGFKLVVE